MHKGISYWSFAADLDSPNPSYEDVFDLARRCDYDAVEASISEDPAHILRFGAPEETLAKTGEAAARAGMIISSLASGDYWGISPTSSNTATRKKAAGLIEDQLRAAAGLGARTILVVPGAVQPQFMPAAEPVGYLDAWERASAVIGEAVPLAEKLDIVIGVENVWNRMLLSPLEMRQFCEQFGSDHVKCYLDVGNVMFNGFPQDWIEILAQKDEVTGRHYLAAIHVKDFRTHFFLGDETGPLAEVREACQSIAPGSAWCGAYAFCDIGEGDLPGEAIMNSLDKVGFDGTLTAEMLPPSKGIVARSSEAMERMMKGRRPSCR